MARSLLLVLPLLLACRTPISAADAQLLTRRSPLIRPKLLKAQDVRMTIGLGRNPKYEQLFQDAELIMKGWKLSDTLPRGIPRSEHPNWDGPLFDPTEILALSVLRELEFRGWAKDGSAACPQSGCPGAELTLEAGIDELKAIVAGDMYRQALQIDSFDGHVKLLAADGREVWDAKCHAEEVAPTQREYPNGAAAAQEILDHAASLCAEQITKALKEAVANPK